jgi:5-formyltetrahydrofolate cyclo-ligase
MTKVELRRSLLKTRTSLAPDRWRAASDRLCAHLQAAPALIQAQTVLAYFSFRQELDLSPLFQREPGKTWGFPRCVGQNLHWHRWSPGQARQSGAFGIWEPSSQAPVLTAAQVDLILVPCVACDGQNYRLGYGGGFYDRLLSAPDWEQVPTIGLCFEWARLERLPIDPWDQPLRSVCTDQGLYP